MSQRRFVQADVFSTKPAKGNGLAVVIDANDLSDEAMQDFAAWTNLAETTFLLTPTDSTADYRVRIFTPAREMPFAGHPTLGSCAAWLHTGGTPKIAECVVQECAIGLVEIDLTGPTPAFVAPPTMIETMSQSDTDGLCEALRIDPSDIRRAARLNNGPSWQVLELATAELVLAIDSSLVQWPEYGRLSVIGAYPEGSQYDFEVRSLAPSSGMSEDPITGSLNSAVAMWLKAQERLTHELTMRQGTCIGREGRVLIRLDQGGGDKVFIGGHAQILIEGVLHL